MLLWPPSWIFLILCYMAFQILLCTNSRKYRIPLLVLLNGKGGDATQLHFWRNSIGFPLDLELSLRYCYLPSGAHQLKQPVYLSDLLFPYIPARLLRSSDKDYLVIPKPHLKSYGFRSFSYSASFLWNELPEHICACSTLSSFKSVLKTHFFTCSFN